MNRETARAIWFRKLDRNCFTSGDTAATEQSDMSAPARRGRWFPRFTAASAAEEWRPLAEDRRRWAIEASGDSAY